MMLLLRGISSGGIVSQGEVWVPIIEQPKKSAPADAPPPSQDGNRTRLILSTAIIAASLTGLALTFRGGR